MKNLKVIFTLTFLFVFVNISGVFAEVHEFYTNADLEKYKYTQGYSQGYSQGAFTNADLEMYEGIKPKRKKAVPSNWKGEISFICEKSAEAGYLSDQNLLELINRSDSLRSVIESMSMTGSQKYSHLITLENCRQSLLAEARYTDKEYEYKRSEKLTQDEKEQKIISEQEALERLTAFKIRHNYNRIRALQIRFCNYRQDNYASYISCGHKLRQDGQPFTAMKLKEQLDSCIEPDTCFDTTKRKVN